MTDNTFRRFRCWQTAAVHETVFSDIGALTSQDDAIFLAAHAPVPVRREKGGSTGHSGAGEIEILNTLKSQFGVKQKNTLIAVTGDVGTGKSHAVRWVHAHLEEDPLRRVIYVPRDLSTLRGLLGRVLEGLEGPKARQAQRSLDSAIGQKPDAQLRDELIDNLRQVLAYELPDQPRGEHNADDLEQRSFLLGHRKDRTEQRRDGMADILLNKKVREHLARDGGTVAAVIRSIQVQRPGRDESYPQFTEDDIPGTERGIIGRLDPIARSVFESMRTDPEPVVALLNEALQRAFRITLGIGTGLTLNEVFLETRELLHQAGAELVLLFEDLALFGLIDDDLYDQFSQPPTGKYCPLRVVFAVTEAKYLEIPSTVRDRVTDWYVISNLDDELGGDSESEMVTFVARYLNNARVGRDALVAAREAADSTARESGAWIPNACDKNEHGAPCPHRDECFGAFGHVTTGPGREVGLYPHNPVSLHRAIEQLRDKGRLSPRSLVYDVTQTFLTTAGPEIAAGIFPTGDIREWFSMGVSRPREFIVDESKVPDPTARERLLVTRIAWADGEPEPPGIHLAFDLPGPVPVPAPVPVPVTGSDGPPPPPLPPPAPSPPVLSRAQSLYDWDGDVRPLPDGEMDSFRQDFHNWTLDRVDLGLHLICAGQGTPQAILASVFTKIAFVIANASGAGPTPGNLRFDVKQTRGGLRLLMAARWYADHGHWDATKPGPGWEAPLDFPLAELQVELENWLSYCAAKVEKQFLETITSAGGARPANAAVILRTAALRVLGQLDRDDPAGVVEAATKDRVSPGGHWSPSWAVLAHPARDAIGLLGPRLITEFAAAYQGDSTVPIVLDAAALEPAGRGALDDPAGTVAGIGAFPDRLGVLERARVSMAVDWVAPVAAERRDLLADLEAIRVTAGPADRDLAGWARDLGRQALDDHLFRPVGQHSQFQADIATLTAHGRGDVDQWLAAEPAIGDPGLPAAVLDAQPWAAAARAYRQAWQRVVDALTATAQYAAERTAFRAGGNPAEIAGRVAADLEDAAGLLDRVGEEPA